MSLCEQLCHCNLPPPWDFMITFYPPNPSPFTTSTFPTSLFMSLSAALLGCICYSVSKFQAVSGAHFLLLSSPAFSAMRWHGELPETIVKSLALGSLGLLSETLRPWMVLILGQNCLAMSRCSVALLGSCSPLFLNSMSWISFSQFMSFIMCQNALQV